MEIIKPGKIRHSGELWWVGATLTCPECEAEFRLTAYDPILLATDVSYEGRCPTHGCGLGFVVYRNPARVQWLVDAGAKSESSPWSRLAGAALGRMEE